MQSAPFWRLADKVGFVMGTLIIISFSFMIGRFPHDLFYHYYVALTLLMLAIRYAHYYSLHWHYYISDFCYFANALVIVLLTVSPKSSWLIKMCFLFSEGAIAVSIKIFRNSLVFHKIDTLTSLFIHLFPMLMMYHIRWFTIPAQIDLPLEEQKFTLLIEEDSWFSYLISMVFIPMVFYGIWSVNYSILNFKIAKERIKRKGN